jgi:glycosyltransferase involved in cell wall biosynthesis
MKILILQDFLRSGGTERQCVLLANAFAAEGHAVTLVTFRPGGALAGTVGPAVRRVTLQPFDLGLDWFAPGLISTVRGAAPEVILCLGRMANSHGWRLARFGPVVATMRTGKSLPVWFRRTLRAAAHVVANSEEARATALKAAGLPAERASVIYNSLVFPPSAATPRNEPLRSALSAGPSTTVLLDVAMFRPEKNQRELVEIVAGLPAEADWQLWLAGDGPARAACEQRARELGAASARVRFLGFHADPAPLYTAADIAVHASWSEALSNFLIEAQAHGLPAVASAAQGIRECFLPGETGWEIPQGDRAAFRAALTRLMMEPAAERARRADLARTFARDRFDPARQVRAYLDLFAAVTAAGRP